MTCFDLGLKLRLLGYECELTPSAHAIHSGYLQQDDIGERRVLEELRCRLLLYKKFLPREEQKHAMQVLQGKIDRWCETRYPRSKVRGAKLSSLYSHASEDVASISTNPYWKRIAEALPQA
jgi:GT2 family glycosyltransferase